MSKLKTYSDQDPTELNADLEQVKTMLSGLKMFGIKEFDNGKTGKAKLKALLDLVDWSINSEYYDDKEKYFKSFSKELDRVFEINNKVGTEAREEQNIIKYQILCAMKENERVKTEKLKDVVGFDKTSFETSKARVNNVYAQLSGKKVDTKDNLIGSIGKTSIWDRLADFSRMISNVVHNIKEMIMPSTKTIEPIMSAPTTPPPPVPDMPNYPPPSRPPLSPPTPVPTQWQEVVADARGNKLQSRK